MSTRLFSIFGKGCIGADMVVSLPTYVRVLHHCLLCSTQYVIIFVQWHAQWRTNPDTTHINRCLISTQKLHKIKKTMQCSPPVCFCREALKEPHDSNVGILENKLTLLTILRFWRYCGPSNYRFNFLLYWYAPWVFFLRSSMCFRVPHLCSKIPKINNWSMVKVVYKVCASAVISPLRQWLDSYAKTRLKMWHTFKHFIHMQYFLLPTNLVIVFVLWVSTGVLYEPRQCSLFWDYIPESKLCFCLNLCRPPGAYSIRVREITLYPSTRGVRGRMKAKQRWFKFTRELCHE